MPVKASRTTTMGRVLSEKRLPTYYSGLSNPIRQGVSVSNWGLCRISAEAFRRPRILQCPKRLALHFSPAGPIIMHAWSSNFKPFWTNALCILDNKTTTSRLPGSRTIWSISLPSSSLPSSFLKFDVLHLKRFAGSHEAFIKAVRLGFNDRLPCNQCPAVARETLQVSTSTWTKLLAGEQKLIKVVRSGETTTWTFVTR